MSANVAIGDMLEEVDERLGANQEPEILSLTEGNGFVLQLERFNKRLATDDTSKYKVVHKDYFAFNPYLLWAGAIACNRTWGKGIVSPAYPVFRLRDGFDASYVDWLLSGEPIRLRYDSISFGAVPRRRRAKVNDFLSITIDHVPPITEQKRIAGILDAADALRAKRRESIEQLDTLIQSTFLEMFGDPKKHEWDFTTVESLAVEKKGSIRTGPFGSQLLHSEFVDSGIRVLGIDNAVQNKFAEGESRYITPEKYKQLARYTVRPGDVLITIMGTCGRCAIVPDDIETAINTKHLCCISLDHEKCNPQFLHAYFLQHPLARKYLERNAKGAIMSGLNMGIIKSLPVPLAPIALQREYADISSAIKSNLAQSDYHLTELDTLFASLQARAFRGEL